MSNNFSGLLNWRTKIDSIEDRELERTELQRFNVRLRSLDSDSLEEYRRERRIQTSGPTPD